MMPMTGYPRSDSLSRVTSGQTGDLKEQARELTDKLTAIAGRIREIESTRGDKAVSVAESEPHLEGNGKGKGARKKMIAVLDQDRCINCGLCVDTCPEQAISMRQRYTVVFDSSRCTGCGLCVERCPVGAISLSELPNRVVSRG